MQLMDPRLLEDDVWDEAQSLEDQRIGDVVGNGGMVVATSASFGVFDDSLKAFASQERETPTTMDDDQAHNDSFSSEAGSDSRSTRRHGMPETNAPGRGVNRIFRKGVSAYNDFLADLNNYGNDEASLASRMMQWYKITHGIDDFPPGQEPLPGTFDCRLCGRDLTTVHKAYDHVQACSKQDASKMAEHLLAQRCPLNRPCTYQRCGHGSQFKQFVLCRETHTSFRAMGEHMREHVRSMTKKKEGRKVLTCFFWFLCPQPRRWSP